MGPSPAPLLAVALRRVTNGTWTLDAVPDDADALVGGTGWTVIAASLDVETDKASLLTALASAGRFPDHFGHNWDALADHLTDLSWLDEGDDGKSADVALVLRGASTWGDEHPSDADVLLDVLADAAAWWARSGRRFVTVWEGRRQPIPSLDLL